MKKILSIIPITFFALLLVIGVGNQKCWADTIPDALDGSGLSILLIDGSNDGVTFTILNFGVAGDVYYSINSSDEWQSITWSGIAAEVSGYHGGHTLDFWLHTDNGDYYSYETGDATVTYSGYIDPSNAETPSWWDAPYYGTVMVDWSTGLNGDFQLEVLTTPEAHDGFAPVPIPKSLLLLGAGLLGLIGFGFRRRKARIT